MTPLEQWTIIFKRPLRMDILESARKHGTQPHCSSLSFKDAYPLLKHICKEWDGDFNPFEFGILEYKDPLVYSVALTITRPDDIAIEFSATGEYYDKNDAKLHAALLAVKEGAIGFILDCPSSVTSSVPLGSPSLIAPVHLIRNNERRVAYHPKEPVKSLRQGVEEPKEALNPAAKQLINHAVQGTFQDRNIKTPKDAQEWNVVEKEHKCFAAQLTVRMPSGVSETYGDIENPIKTYASDKEARLATASQAIDAGVLLFIAAERFRNYSPPTATSLALAPVLSHRKTLPQTKAIVPFRTLLPSNNSVDDHSHVRTPLALSSSIPLQPSPPAASSSSQTLEPSILFDPTTLPERGTKRARSEDDTSEASALEAHLPTIVLFPSPDLKVGDEESSRVGQPGGLEVPHPAKKQKTKSTNEREAAGNSPTKPGVIYGPAYAVILSDFCAQTGLAPPKFFREKQRDGAFKVVLLVDGCRYDLRKGYQTVELAKERLSKRFLALKGVTAVKE